MSELKACPFCGHTPMIFNQTGLVTCRYSMCSANPQANSKEDWNKRTNDRLEQENAELMEFVNRVINDIDGHDQEEAKYYWRNELDKILNK